MKRHLLAVLCFGAVLAASLAWAQERLRFQSPANQDLINDLSLDWENAPEDALREQLLRLVEESELRNVLERALLLSDGDELGREDLHFEPDQAEVLPSDAKMSLRDIEIHHITRTLKNVHGNVPLAAQRLGIPKSSLYQKLKTYELDPSRFRTANTPAG